MRNDPLQRELFSSLQFTILDLSPFAVAFVFVWPGSVTIYLTLYCIMQHLVTFLGVYKCDPRGDMVFNVWSGLCIGGTMLLGFGIFAT